MTIAQATVIRSQMENIRERIRLEMALKESLTNRKREQHVYTFDMKYAIENKTKSISHPAVADSAEFFEAVPTDELGVEAYSMTRIAMCEALINDLREQYKSLESIVQDVRESD